jgi:hypothetical protein
MFPTVPVCTGQEETDILGSGHVRPIGFVGDATISWLPRAVLSASTVDAGQVWAVTRWLV